MDSVKTLSANEIRHIYQWLFASQPSWFPDKEKREAPASEEQAGGFRVFFPLPSAIACCRAWVAGWQVAWSFELPSSGSQHGGGVAVGRGQTCSMHEQVIANSPSKAVLRRSYCPPPQKLLTQNKVWRNYFRGDRKRIVLELFSRELRNFRVAQPWRVRGLSSRQLRKIILGEFISW